MSKFVLNLREATAVEPAFVESAPAMVEPQEETASKPRRRKLLRAAGLVVLSGIVIAGIAGFVYWQRLKTTPQYSLALLIDASRKGDKDAANALVDTDAVVDDFVPQITSKAIELYGRGIPPDAIAKMANVARPLMPAVKERARAELPNVIRERTEKLENIPFFAMAVGADRYLDIQIDGDTAQVKSKIPDHQFEMKMHRSGDRWRITGVKDDQLATMIAQKIGQQIIAVATKGGINRAGETLGIKNLADIVKQAEGIFDER